MFSEIKYLITAKHCPNYQNILLCLGSDSQEKEQMQLDMSFHMRNLHLMQEGPDK